MSSRVDPAVERFYARAATWREESLELRGILQAAGLDEALKWGKPCYGVDGKNIAILQPMKGHLSLMFFKGALLHDPRGLLVRPGENSIAARRLHFKSVADVKRAKAAIEHFVEQAAAVERAGLEVEKPKTLELVGELERRLREDPALRAAFRGLTKGRQREYNLYLSSAKRASTRESRLDKVAPRILSGKGLRD